MARKSARILGYSLNLNPHEVNLKLEELGYIKKSRYVTQRGAPVWDITEEGKLHGEPSHHPYSHGYIWDDDVIDEIRKIL